MCVLELTVLPHLCVLECCLGVSAGCANGLQIVDVATHCHLLLLLLLLLLPPPSLLIPRAHASA
jgi:hypothetical protein